MTEKLLKIKEIAFKTDRKPSAVLKWVKKGLFPNATLNESQIVPFWEIPESDYDNFILPQRGQPKKSASSMEVNP